MGGRLNKSFIALTAFLLFSLNLFSNYDAEYYLRKINSSNGIEKFQTMNNYSVFLRNKDILKSLEIGIEIFDYIESNPQDNQEFYELTIDVYKNLGETYISLKQYSQAFQFFKVLSEIAKNKYDKVLLVDSTQLMAKLHTIIQDYPKADQYYKDALKQTRAEKDKYQCAKILIEMGNIQRLEKNYDIATKYFSEAEIIATKNSYSELYGELLLSIGRLYMDNQDFIIAKEYIIKGLGLFIDTGNEFRVAQMYNELGWIYSQQKEWEKAIEYNTKAGDLRVELGSVSLHASSLINTGKVYYEWGKYKKSLELYEKAELLLIQQSDRESKKNLQRCYICMFDSYEKLKDYKNGIKYFQKYLQVKSLITQTEISAINNRNLINRQLIPKVNFTQERKAVDDQSQNWNIVVLFFLVCSASFIHYRIIKIRRINNLISEQEKLNSSYLETLEELKEKQKYIKHIEEIIYSKNQELSNETSIRLVTEKKLNNVSQEVNNINTRIESQIKAKIDMIRKNDLTQVLNATKTITGNITKELLTFLDLDKNNTIMTKQRIAFENLNWLQNNNHFDLVKVVKESLNFIEINYNMKVNFEHSLNTFHKIRTKPFYLFSALNYIFYPEQKKSNEINEAASLELNILPSGEQGTLKRAQIIIKCTDLYLNSSRIEQLNNDVIIETPLRSIQYSKICLAKSVIKLLFKGEFEIKKFTNSYEIVMSFLVS